MQTDRLLLKNYTHDDFKSFFLLKTADKVWEYSTFAPYQSEEKALEDFNIILISKPYQFNALFTKESNIFIGEAGIISLNPNANRCVIGYNLLPDYWGRGYATEITKALVTYAFETLDIERVEAIAMLLNTSSCKVLLKSGFTLEGVLRHFIKIRGDYYDVGYYSIISGDYF
ncbi:MAG: GNAT family N-acetyltransferase [Defluviitaleaceae bacterium]|nr:GNAT family N-acetyltransferase [Defluviitaleaceae bacterium]